MMMAGRERERAAAARRPETPAKKKLHPCEKRRAVLFGEGRRVGSRDRDSIGRDSGEMIAAPGRGGEYCFVCVL